VRSLCLATIILSFAISARASSVFSIDQGTVSATGSCASGVQNCPVSATYSFTGPGLSSSGSYSGNGVDFALLFGNTYIFQMQFVASGPLNGGSFGPGLFVRGGMVVSSGLFSLPAANTFASGTSITVNLPINFFGSLAVCASTCAAGQFASYGFNGNLGRPGTAQLQFTSSGSTWSFTSGSLTLLPTPEPGTMSLVGLGALGVLGRFFRRKS
jgi:PEP-CTERM motif